MKVRLLALLGSAICSISIPFTVLAASFNCTLDMAETPDPAVKKIILRTSKSVAAVSPSLFQVSGAKLSNVTAARKRSKRTASSAAPRTSSEFSAKLVIPVTSGSETQTIRVAIKPGKLTAGTLSNTGCEIAFGSFNK